MKSLEHKSEPMLEEPMMREYPSFHVSGEQMPEINDWEVGEEYTLKVKVRMMNYDKSESVKGSSSHACIEVMEYEKA